MIKTAILGCGKIAAVRHAPEYAANPDCVLAGYYNPTRRRAEELAEKYGGRVYDSAEELLSDVEIDAVSVCAANYAHADLTIKALRAGKHVLCEKPMATAIEDCEEMLRVSKECGRLLMIAHNQRFAEAHIKAKQLLEAGEIGRVLSFRSCFCHSGPENWSVTPGSGTWFFKREKAAFGAMADLGIHKTDLIQYLLGQRVIRVTARLFTLDKIGADGEKISVDDNSFCIYEMSGGAVGTVTAGWSSYGSEDNSTIIYGTEGVMRIYDDPHFPIVIQRRSGETLKLEAASIQTNASQTASGVIDEWINCVKTGREPVIDTESVICAMRAVFAAAEASEKGCTVEIPENML